jgi:hypothetical protein
MKPQGPYWFPAKRFGWGWGLPTVWQGWLVLASYALLMIAAGFLFPPDTQLNAFIVCVAVLSALLVFICWLTGEPPSWRWGRDD